MIQIQFIEDINVEITNNILKINFICDSKINVKELEEYYFISQVFKSIKAFSQKLKLTPIVLINNNE